MAMISTYQTEFLALKAKRRDPDEMQHSVEFHLGLHFLL